MYRVVFLPTASRYIQAELWSFEERLLDLKSSLISCINFSRVDSNDDILLGRLLYWCDLIVPWEIGVVTPQPQIIGVRVWISPGSWSITHIINLPFRYRATSLTVTIWMVSFTGITHQQRIAYYPNLPLLYLLCNICQLLNITTL